LVVCLHNEGAKEKNNQSYTGLLVVTL